MGGIRGWWKRAGGAQRADDTGPEDPVNGGATEPAGEAGRAEAGKTPGGPPTGERTAAQDSLDQLLRQAADRRPPCEEEPPSA
jgi:hypothetical protein